jgi:two-component system sensor histidine kinase DegS
MIQADLRRSNNKSRAVLGTVFHSWHFWIVASMLLLSALLYYAVPDERQLALSSLPLTLHSIQLVVFLLPVAGAAFAFGRTPGIAVLGLSAAIVLPRILLSSPDPIDALFEMLGVLTVGGVFIWLVDVKEREKRIGLKAIEKLEALNTISSTLCQATDLDDTLNRALDKVLEVVPNLESKGVVFLLDGVTHKLRLTLQRGFSPALLEQGIEVPLGECLCGAAAESRKVLVAGDAQKDPRHTRCLETAPHSHVCIPLQSKEHLLGMIDLYLKDARPVDVVDQQLFSTIGRQVGVAIENARLCEKMRFYIRQITQAQEIERKRIARELHDETAQGLVDISRRLDDLAAGWDRSDNAAGAEVESIHERIDSLLQGIRRFSRDLRPSVLDDLGLLPALEGLIDEVRQHDIESSLSTKGVARRLPVDAELALFRIVQESLNNVRRHSRATRVDVGVEFLERRVRATVHDNGHGFRPQGRMSDLVAAGKFGIAGMEERVQLLGGYFAVLTSLDTGTIVLAEVPY